MNKESTWEECIDSNSSIKISMDKEKSKSLRDTAKERIKYLNDEKCMKIIQDMDILITKII